MRHINNLGIALVKKHEELKLHASLASDGQVTIGYGHVGRGIEVGREITEDEADLLLLSDLAQLGERVLERVSVPLNDNEFSVIVSLAFAIGIRRLSQSTFLRLLNRGEKARAADAIMWLGQPDEYCSHNVVTVISNRRRDEKALFLRRPDGGLRQEQEGK